MAKTWQLQEAKAKFSQVVDDALKDGPQVITRHGREAVVVVSHASYVALTRPERTVPLSRFFRESPLAGVTLDLARDEGLPRPPLDL